MNKTGTCISFDITSLKITIISAEGSDTNALEIAMNLEALSIQDTNIGVQQIELQLASVHMVLQDLKRGKEIKSEIHSEVLCMKCKDEGHHKDPVFQDYIGAGDPDPLKQESSDRSSPCTISWCSICKSSRKLQ